MKQPPHYQRGIALITAVLIVSLATILAVDVAFNAYLDQRRGATTFALDQGYEVALGAEAWAADTLALDAKQQRGSQQTDDFTEAWATPIPPLPLDDGEVEGQLEDMQGRFNLNNLVMQDPQQPNKLVGNPVAIKQFERLLRLLELEDKWAPVIVDWIDSDVQPEGTNGAEDAIYSALTPAYRTPNMPITRTSELLAIAGFDLAHYRKLEPYVAALPIGTTINVCTARYELLDAVANTKQWSTSKRSNDETRKQRCFPTVDDFKPSATDQADIQGTVIGQSSDYFRASIWVTIGTSQFTLYSLLHRTKGTQTQIRPVLRSAGTP